MERCLLIAVLTLLILSCKNKQIEDSEVLTDLVLSEKSASADGQTVIEVSVRLNDRASADRRSVRFVTTSGTFLPTGKDTATVKAEFANGILTAITRLRVSTTPGIEQISVKPEFDHPSQDVELVATLTTTPSVPKSLKLNPSGFGLASNFASEISLVALLKNKEEKFVSAGFKVLFEDVLVSGQSAGGRFRNLQDLTTDSSITKVSYAAAMLPIGTDVVIKATLLDSIGQKTSLSDYKILTINR